MRRAILTARGNPRAENRKSATALTWPSAVTAF